jgi:hypothetical protein
MGAMNRYFSNTVISRRTFKGCAVSSVSWAGYQRFQELF